MLRGHDDDLGVLTISAALLGMSCKCDIMDGEAAQKHKAAGFGDGVFNIL